MDLTRKMGLWRGCYTKGSEIFEILLVDAILTLRLCLILFATKKCQDWTSSAAVVSWDQRDPNWHKLPCN